MSDLNRKPPHRVVHPKGRRPVVSGLLAAAVAAVGVVGVMAWPRPEHAAARVALQAQEGQVTTIDGRTFEGQITESGDEIVINTNGIITTLKRSDVTQIEYGSPEERLRTRLGQVSEENAAGRLDIAEEAIRRDLLDLADEIVQGVLERHPNDRRADNLAARINRERELTRSRGQGRDRNPPANRGRDRQAPPQQGGRSNAGPAQARLGDLLSDEQINRVRQAELQEADAAGRSPRIRFENRVIRRFVDSQQGLDFREFNRAGDVQKALYILANTNDEEIIDDVMIVTDPRSLLTFKQRVHQTVIETCATSQCHGGREPVGGFLLYPDGREDPTVYTNFVSLSMAERLVDDPTGGAFGGDGQVVRQMIDRQDPDNSLLLQYLLPPGLVTYPHPQVEGYQPRFQNPDANAFQMIRNWIGTQLERPRPDYNIDFTPPGQQPTTRPSTAPAQQQRGQGGEQGGGEQNGGGQGGGGQGGPFGGN